MGLKLNTMNTNKVKQAIELATATSITSTYAGEFAGKYIAAALNAAPTIGQSGITMVPNVKYKQVIKKFAVDGILKDATCDFTDTSTVTLTERLLVPKELQVNLEFCKKDFHSDWEAELMGYSAFDKMPPSFQEFLIAHMIAKVAANLEDNIWGGDDTTANTGVFDGLYTLTSADSDVIDVTAATTANITSSNVLTELGLVADLIPSAIYGAEDLKIYVSQRVAKAYIRALGGYAANGLGANGYENKGTQWFSGRGVGNVGLEFDGIPLFVTNGLTGNQMVAAQTSNLFFGTGMMSDHNEVRILDMADLDGSQNVRFIMRLTGCVNYGIGSEIVRY